MDIQDNLADDFKRQFNVTEDYQVQNILLNENREFNHKLHYETLLQAEENENLYMDIQKDLHEI